MRAVGGGVGRRGAERVEIRSLRLSKGDIHHSPESSAGGRSKLQLAHVLHVFFAGETGVAVYCNPSHRSVVYVIHQYISKGTAACGLVGVGGKEARWRRCRVERGNTHFLNKYFRAPGRDPVIT